MLVLCTLLLVFIVLFLLPFLTFMVIFKSIDFGRFDKSRRQPATLSARSGS